MGSRESKNFSVFKYRPIKYSYVFVPFLDSQQEKFAINDTCTELLPTPGTPLWPRGSAYPAPGGTVHPSLEASTLDKRTFRNHRQK